MRFAYADPPYLGYGRYYDHPEAAVYNTIQGHHDLVKRLCDEYPDGWALSASSPSLPKILLGCPEDVRIGAWVKPFSSFKPGVNPAYAWEPVIYRGGRKRPRTEDTVKDWHSESITLRKGLTGAKPGGFALWIVKLLGADFRQGDVIVDLFPGTGAMQSVWQASA